MASFVKYDAGKQAFQYVMMSNKPTVRIEDAGRGGSIYFKNDYTSFSLWWEFAGGDAIAIIEAPTGERWISRTGLPVAEREEVLNFIAKQVVGMKLPSGGYFSIGENSITVYAGKQDAGA